MKQAISLHWLYEMPFITTQLPDMKIFVTLFGKESRTGIIQTAGGLSGATLKRKWDGIVVQLYSIER
jgi:hypothetical protein